MLMPLLQRLEFSNLKISRQKLIYLILLVKSIINLIKKLIYQKIKFQNLHYLKDLIIMSYRILQEA